jgi:hypothetical protein
MNKTLFYTIASLAILLTGCGGNKINHNTSKLEQISLESTEFISDSLLGKPKNLVVADSAVIVVNSDALNDSLVSIFNLSGKLVKSCMYRGQGSLDVLDISNVQYSGLDNSLYVMDIPFASCKIFRISNYLNPGTEVEKVMSTASNDSVMPSGGAVRLSNGQIVAGNANPAGLVAIIGNDGNSTRLFGHVPEKSLIDSRLSDFGNSTIYHPFVAVSPNGNFAAFYYDVSDMHLIIKVVDNKTVMNFTEGEPATGIALTEVAPGVCVGAVTGETFCNTQGISLSNRYIYQLYIGLLTEDLEKTDFFRDAKHYGANTVKVLDCEGNHIKTITLDRWATALAVSPDDKYLYTLTQSSENGYAVLRYEL